MEIKPPKYTRDLSLMNGYPLPRVPKYVDSVRPTAEWYAKHRKVNKKAWEKLAMERNEQIWGVRPDSDISDTTRTWLAHKECTEHKQWPPCPGDHKKEPSDALYGELL